MDSRFTSDYNDYLSSINNIIERSKDKKYTEQFLRAFALIRKAVEMNSLVICCGNGGSASDSSHFAAELVCRFEKNRRPIKAISITTDMSIVSAISNDINYETIFSRQVDAIGSPNDLLIIFSTSGTSPNCLEAAKVAKSKGLFVILFTGLKESTIAEYSDVVVQVPSTRTCHIQEVNRIQYHLLCSWIEEAFESVE